MATGLVGQFDPAFSTLMGETQELLRQVFRTRNRSTFPVPGTSRAAFRSRLLETHGVEIMGAFGSLAGRIWRIGTMADNARPAPVLRTLGALADAPGARARGTLQDALTAAALRFDALARTPA